VDLNVPNGISRAVKELMINKIVLGWNGKITTTNFFFGSIIENLIGSTEQMVMVVKISNPLNTTSRIIVSIPENAEREAGFFTWLNMIKIMAYRTSASLLFSGYENSHSEIRNFLETEDSNIKIEYQTSHSAHPIIDQSRIANIQDFYVVIAARRRTLSYEHYFEHMPRDLARHFENKNFIIIYPEQRAVELQTLSSSLDGLEVSAIKENLERYTNLTNPKRNSPDSRHNSLTE
jgi:hypothetical protein